VGAAEALGGSIRYRLKHTLGIFVQLVVPYAKNGPAFLPKRLVPRLVAQRVGMLTAVEFNNQPGLSAGEVRDVGSDRQLARELWPQPGQHAPKLALMPGRIVAQRSCALRLIEWNSPAHALGRSPMERFAHPPLTPPFQGGGTKVRFPPIADIRIDATALQRHAGPMRRQLLIGAAVAMALVLGWFAWSGWFYLQRGYSLSVAMAGHPDSVFHIDFPTWRAAVHVLLWAAAMAAIVAYVTARRWAPTAAWLTFAATMAIGIYDVVQYGTMGSPSSIWTVLLLLLFSLLTRFGPLAPRATA